MTEFKDKFGRVLKEGDICFRVKIEGNNRMVRTRIFPVNIKYFSEQKVKIAEKTFVDSTSLILASPEGLLI